MSLVKITGNVLDAAGEPPVAGFLEFRLSAPFTNVAGKVVTPMANIITSITPVTGEIEVWLETNIPGTPNNTYYTVVMNVITRNARIRKAIGLIQPDDPTPPATELELGQLLITGIVNT